MATLREYYDTDFTMSLGIKGTNQVQNPQGKTLLEITSQVHIHHNMRARIISYFVPLCGDPTRLIRQLVDQPKLALELDKEVLVKAGGQADFPTSNRECVFTGRMFVYFDGEIGRQTKEELRDYAMANVISLQIRDHEYMRERNKWEQPLAFISHDSRDKDAIAKPIAEGLIRLMCPVWFDEYSLQPGDSLREKIEKGLKECKKCILVLSNNFLENDGWTKREFDSILNRELIEERALVVPVWCGVTKEQVYQYSPYLVGILGIDWSLGRDEVAARLRQVILR